MLIKVGQSHEKQTGCFLLYVVAGLGCEHETKRRSRRIWKQKEERKSGGINVHCMHVQAHHKETLHSLLCMVNIHQNMTILAMTPFFFFFLALWKQIVFSFFQQFNFLIDSLGVSYYAPQFCSPPGPPTVTPHPYHSPPQKETNQTKKANKTKTTTAEKSFHFSFFPASPSPLHSSWCSGGFSVPYSMSLCPISFTG